MGVIGMLLVGGLVGWLASIVMKTNAQMGMIANVIVGVFGSWIGGVLARVLGVGGGVVVHLVISVVGAVILIAVLKMAGIFK